MRNKDEKYGQTRSKLLQVVESFPWVSWGYRITTIRIIIVDVILLLPIVKDKRMDI